MEKEKKSDGQAREPSSPQDEPGESEVFVAQVQNIHESTEDTGMD